MRRPRQHPLFQRPLRSPVHRRVHRRGRLSHRVSVAASTVPSMTYTGRHSPYKRHWIHRPLEGHEEINVVFFRGLPGRADPRAPGRTTLPSRLRQGHRVGGGHARHVRLERRGLRPSRLSAGLPGQRRRTGRLRHGAVCRQGARPRVRVLPRRTPRQLGRLRDPLLRRRYRARAAGARSHGGPVDRAGSGVRPGRQGGTPGAGDLGLLRPARTRPFTDRVGRHSAP